MLSPGTLDRCVDEEDWVRREIILALELNKNIVGVGLPGFVMPEEEALPDSVAVARHKAGLCVDPRIQGGLFRKIAENLVSTKMKKKRNRQKMIVLLPVLVALVVALVCFPARRREPETVKSRNPRNSG